MKKISYSLLSLLLLCLSNIALFAAAPTTPASALNYTNVQGDRMTLNWTNGNGTSRIIIARQGSPVTFNPVNGVSYGNYTSVGSGQVVIYAASTSTTVFSSMGTGNLSIGTTYYFKVVEFNGSGTGTQYLNSPSLSGSQATLSMALEPTGAVSSATVDWKYEEAYAGSTRQKMGITWSPGNGQRTLIIARAGTAVDPAVIPSDGVRSYQWQNLANNHFVCFYGTGNYMEFKSDGFTKLLPNTTYYFLFVTLNGDGIVSNYLASSYRTLSGMTLANAPTTPSSGLNFTNVQTNQMTLNWTSGSGPNRIIIAKKGSAVTNTPNNSSGYVVGTALGNNEFVIYNGSGNTFTLNGGTALGTITANTAYYFAIYEYSGNAVGNYSYLSPPLTGNQTTLNYSAEPTISSSALNFTNIQTNQLTANWTNGNGAQRIVIARTGSAVTAAPSDGVTYSVNQSLASGQVVVYQGTGNSYTLNNTTGLGTLSPNTTYYFAIYEYNGTGSTLNYLTSTSLSGSQATANYTAEPTASSTGLFFTNVQTNQLTANWTNGNGAQRIIIARTSSAVTSVPTDGVAYTVNQSLASGQVVVYQGTGSSYTLNNTTGLGTLSPNTTYYFAIYEFNGSGTSINYLTSSSLSGSQATANYTAEPTASSTGLFFTNVQTNQLTANWTNGNGAQRIIIARTGSAVTSVPTDGVAYSVNQSLSSGQVVVYQGTGTSYTLNNTTALGTLSPNTTYYFAIYEFNGSGTSINYLTSSSLSGSQATAGFTAEPTVAASNLIFSNVHSNRMALSWTNGNGSARIVVLRQGSPVSAAPTDGVSYSNYTSLGAGQIILYNGTASTLQVNHDGSVALAPNTTYYYAVYEYNGSGSGTNYLTSSFLSGSQTTLSSGRVGTDNEGNISYIAYPNPATDVLNFNLPASDVSRQISLINSVGEKVYSYDASQESETMQINLKDLKKGFYYLTVSSEREVIVQEKVMVY